MIRRTSFYPGIATLLFLLGFFSVTATAQSSVYPRSEAYGGISFLLGSGGGGGGGRFSYTRYWNRYFGWEVNGAVFVEGPAAGFRGKSQFLMAGLRYVERGEWDTYHFHALAGITHYTVPVHSSILPIEHISDTAFTWQVGGGWDLNLTDRWGWRPVQFDIIKVYPPNPTSFSPAITWSVFTGFVFKWGDVDD